MNRAAYALISLLFVGTAGPGDLRSGQDPMIAQSGPMSHEMQGAGKSHSQPMGGMKVEDKGDGKVHDHQEHHEQLNVPSQMRPRSALKPAEGASVKILSPKEGEGYHGDEVTLHFELIKGKRGDHVHAYVDGELMGMFKSEKGTLTGIKPGRHMLELRVVAEDHQTELDATDTVHFVVE